MRKWENHVEHQIAKKFFHLPSPPHYLCPKWKIISPHLFGNISPHLSNLEGTFNSNHVKNSQISGLGKQPLMTPLIFKALQRGSPTMVWICPFTIYIHGSESMAKQYGIKTEAGCNEHTYCLIQPSNKHSWKYHNNNNKETWGTWGVKYGAIVIFLKYKIAVLCANAPESSCSCGPELEFRTGKLFLKTYHTYFLKTIIISMGKSVQKAPTLKPQKGHPFL